MRIKKFTGATLKEATDVMKEELGSDAIILNTRKVHKSGLLNFLGKEAFEITAAIDEQAVTANREKVFAKELALAGVAQAPVAAGNEALSGLQKMAEKFEHRINPSAPSLHNTAGYLELKNEVESLKSIMHEVASHLKYAKMPSLPEHLKHAYMSLIEQDVEEGFAAELTQRVYRKLGEDFINNRQKVTECLLNEMSALFKQMPSDSSRKKQKVVALVGPTGVGKTTTIAKLAAISKLMEKKEVALISADTYRIGAIEQLRTFAAIADIPMEIVYQPREMKTALAKFKSRDIVFIDTVGRSPRAKKEIAELARFIGEANPQEVHLVLSASMNNRALKEVTENFRVTAPNRIIFSKMDEAVTFGQVLNIAHATGLPVSFLTTGQSVPDDISVASNMQLARMVYTGEVHD